MAHRMHQVSGIGQAASIKWVVFVGSCDFGVLLSSFYMAESWTRALHCACRTFVCHFRYVIAETTVISSTDPVYNTKSRKSPLRRLVASQHMTKNTRLYSPALLLQRCSRAAAEPGDRPRTVASRNDASPYSRDTIRKLWFWCWTV